MLRRIEIQEVAGHAALVGTREVLPIRGTLTGNDGPTANVQRHMAVLGLEIGDKVDDLFVAVKLPPGWSKRAAADTMWTDLLDEQGRKRAAIFSDRDAFINWNCRYQVHRQYPQNKDYANGKITTGRCYLMQARQSDPAGETRPARSAAKNG